MDTASSRGAAASGADTVAVQAPSDAQAISRSFPKRSGIRHDHAIGRVARYAGSAGRLMGGRTMGELIGIARFRFHPGRVEEYKRLSAEAMDIVRAREPGTLEYAIFLNGDESEAVVFERFASSEALLEHGANMAEISVKVLQTGTVEGELLGEPNDELRARFTGPEPELFLPYLSLKPR
jgi:quinol monooxygenase YgiN